MRDQRFENSKFATLLGEAALYNRFNIQATVSHVSDIDNHERDRNMMVVRTAVVHDQMGFATMTVFITYKGDRRGKILPVY